MRQNDNLNKDILNQNNGNVKNRFKRGLTIVLMLFVLAFAGCKEPVPIGTDSATNTETSITDSEYHSSTTDPEDSSSDTSTQKPDDTSSQKPDTPPIDTDSSTQKPDDSSSDQRPDNPPDVQDDITIDQLFNNHYDKAKYFVDTIVSSQVLQGKTILSKAWSMTATADNKIDSIKLVVTEKGEGNQRNVEFYQLVLDTPLDIDAIVNQSFVMANGRGTLKSQTILSFDAKEKYATESATFQKEINDLIQSKLDSNYMIEDDYTLEVFTASTTQELLTEYKDTFHDIFDQYFFESAMKKTARGYDVNKIADIDIKIEDGEAISQMQFVVHYAANGLEANNRSFSIVNINLSSPIKVSVLFGANKDTILKDASANATYTVDYSFGYDISKQNDRNDLINAIFKTLGYSETPASDTHRLYVDMGRSAGTDIGDAQVFKVLEISSDGISYLYVNIYYSFDGDKGLIEYLDEGRYSVPEQKIIEFADNTLEYVSTSAPLYVATAKTQNPSNIITFTKIEKIGKEEENQSQKA